ncbi:hypothetical protein [Hazenella coriacea]|uniref:Uncharacterized protein n=1 Tax=Hazenella coriacea TaxID=1179467 RepID=A0A4V2UVR4_9BACL|nr:hypothetical protein [Hazenella coriacea]TCS96807.1 hypothetical protein EDD58_101449 [Hazenella coriacea]
MENKSTVWEKWEKTIFKLIFVYFFFVFFGYFKCWFSSIIMIETICLPTVAKWTLPILYCLVYLIVSRPWKKRIKNKER